MFKWLYKKQNTIESKSLKTIKDLDFFDDVWIEEEGEIYKGWIFEISRRHITVVYDNAKKDYMFHIPRQDDKILYCNDPIDK